MQSTQITFLHTSQDTIGLLCRPYLLHFLHRRRLRGIGSTTPYRLSSFLACLISFLCRLISVLCRLMNSANGRGANNIRRGIGALSGHSRQHPAGAVGFLSPARSQSILQADNRQTPENCLLGSTATRARINEAALEAVVACRATAQAVHASRVSSSVRMFTEWI